MANKLNTLFLLLCVSYFRLVSSRRRGEPVDEMIGKLAKGYIRGQRELMRGKGMNPRQYPSGPLQTLPPLSDATTNNEDSEETSDDTNKDKKEKGKKDKEEKNKNKNNKSFNSADKDKDKDQDNKDKNKDKNNKDKNKNNGGGASVVEYYECIPFESSRIQQRAAHANSECSTNSCSSGCCRDYNWLLCDADNSLPFMRCVCNENTQVFEKKTTIPTVAPTNSPTDSPTPAPTDAPTDEPTNTPTPAPSPSPTPSPTIDSNSNNGSNGMAGNNSNNGMAGDSGNSGMNGNSMSGMGVNNHGTGQVRTLPPNASTTGSVSVGNSASSTDGSQNDGSGNGGYNSDILPSACEAGSIFHQLDVLNHKCWRHSDCKAANHCCLSKFCLCGNAEGRMDDCVPPYENE